MIKKFILTLIIFFILFSCGKKGDPEYKKSERKFLFQKVIISKA
tara:strand:+ start:185 stop:316 length:132 start_codon:yes stop_codon:yes gene_type:complete